jgi:hypothetical protein
VCRPAAAAASAAAGMARQEVLCPVPRRLATTPAAAGKQKRRLLLRLTCLQRLRCCWVRQGCCVYVCLRVVGGLLARPVRFACSSRAAPPGVHWRAVPAAGGVHRGRRGEVNPGKGEAPHSTSMTNNQPKPHTCTAQHTASSGAGHERVLQGAAAAMGCASPPPTNKQPATHPHLLRNRWEGAVCVGKEGGWCNGRGGGRPRGTDIPTPNQHPRNHAYQSQSLLCLVVRLVLLYRSPARGRQVQPIVVPPLCLLSRPRVCLWGPRDSDAQCVCWVCG